MNKVENKAENHLIVGSLEVIQDVSGAGFDVITRAIDSLQQGISTVAKKQTDFFKNISDDSIVTPSEKATLKKQWDEIVNEYYAIMDLAEKKQCEDTNEVREYSEAYNELRDYLFSELHIFDDMSSNTALPNVDTFNGLYENYYNKQKYAENRCAAGNDYWTLRVLDNLDQSGSDNEVAVYMGNLYKYSTQEGKWRQVSTAEYYGVKDEFFEANLDDYFLSITDSVKTVLKIDDEGILVNEDGLPILFDYETEAGTIYRMDVAGWNKIEDRNDWHYVVAQNDLLAAGFDPSPVLKDYLDKEMVDKGLPAYMGPLAEPPASWHPGDWFIYSGSESVIWEYAEGLSINLYKGHVYKFNQPTWTDLDPSDSRYNQEFMTALNDLIDLNMGKDAYFANLFVKKIFAMQAVIEELQTKVIELTEGGCIKTQGYKKGSDEKGVYIGANGDFECTDGKFKGEINATSGTFSGLVKAKGLDFTLEVGDILQFSLTRLESINTTAVGGESYGQYIIIPFSGKIKYKMIMENTFSGSGSTNYYFYVNNNIYKSFTFDKQTKHIYEGVIEVKEGDKLNPWMTDWFGGGRLAVAYCEIEFFTDNTNYFLNVINKTQIVVTDKYGNPQ